MMKRVQHQEPGLCWLKRILFWTLSNAVSSVLWPGGLQGAHVGRCFSRLSTTFSVALETDLKLGTGPQFECGSLLSRDFLIPGSMAGKQTRLRKITYPRTVNSRLADTSISRISSEIPGKNKLQNFDWNRLLLLRTLTNEDTNSRCLQFPL